MLIIDIEHLHDWQCDEHVDVMKHRSPACVGTWSATFIPKRDKPHTPQHAIEWLVRAVRRGTC